MHAPDITSFPSGLFSLWWKYRSAHLENIITRSSYLQKNRSTVPSKPLIYFVKSLPIENEVKRKHIETYNMFSKEWFMYSELLPKFKRQNGKIEFFFSSCRILLSLSQTVVFSTIRFQSLACEMLSSTSRLARSWRPHRIGLSSSRIS